MSLKFSSFVGLAILTLATPAVFCAEPRGDAKDAVAFQMEAQPVDRSNKEKLASYADTLDKVTPAVVSIRTAQVVRIMPRGRSLEDILRQWHGLPPLGQDERNVQPREQKVPTGLGSGTIIHPEGYILTNRHVISDQNGDPAEEIIVELADKREFTAKVIGSDPRTDVAIIKIEGKNLPVAKIADSEMLRVGDVVFAIGNPMGVGMTVTSGIVSALGREVGILGQAGLESFIQTDASINPGNSGGPLVDVNGRVVGMNTAIVSRTGGSIGIGFAVPSNLAVDIVTSLVNRGKISRGYLGVEGQDVTTQLAESLGLPAPKGAFINRVEEDSPADKGGIKAEDTVVAVNGDAVDRWSSLRYLASKLKPGDKAKVEVYRDGKKKTLTITVGSQDDVKVALFENQVELKELTDDLRNQFGIPAIIKGGVVITRIVPGSVFDGQVPVGTVVLAVNGVATWTPEDMGKAMKKDQINRLRVFANGRTWALTIRP